MKAVGSVTDMTEHAAERAVQLAVARARHPSTVKHSGPRKALLTAAAMIATCDLPDADIRIACDGTVLVFDYTGLPHPAGSVRQACQALDITVEERPAETPDGCAAIEYRGHDVLDGIYRCIRAVIPVQADWHRCTGPACRALTPEPDGLCRDCQSLARDAARDAALELVQP